MTNKIDPMMALFANHNTKNDPTVISNKSFKGNQKYILKNITAIPMTTTFETIEAIETPTIKTIETEK
jgi:hypothetical protein